MKALVPTDAEVRQLEGHNYMISWGEREVMSVFGTSSFTTALSMTEEYVSRWKQDFQHFSCSHQGCPSPLGYLHGLGLMEFKLTPDGDLQVSTITACIFVPVTHRVQFEKLRLEAVLSGPQKHRTINSFAAVSH